MRVQEIIKTLDIIVWSFLFLKNKTEILLCDKIRKDKK